MKRLLIILSVLILVPSAFAADSDLVEKAKAEGQVSFYANMTAIQPIMDVFNAQTGLKGKYTRISTSKFLATVLTEYQAGKLMADVLQAPLPVMQMLKTKGVLAPYTSPSGAGYPAWTREDDHIQTFGIEYVGLIYNKELVKPADAPTRYEDLTDPKWKNKIVMANPAAHATTISWLVGLKENLNGCSSSRDSQPIDRCLSNRSAPHRRPLKAAKNTLLSPCLSTSSPRLRPPSTGPGWSSP
jgi:iron(III) transport system substrate-binding protein